MLTCEQPKGRDGLGKKVGPLSFCREWQAALPGLGAFRLIPTGSTVDNLLAIMATHTASKPKPGLFAIYPTTNLVHCPKRMDMIAINNYFWGVSLEGVRRTPPLFGYH